MRALTVTAPAKINLGLEVLGRRSDGYHEVVTILQSIDLADELTVEPAAEVTVLVDPPVGIPLEDNLVLRAVRLLRAAARVDRGARIRLVKRIPIAAGLGGGSADAAATLRALNGLWELNWPDERLEALARRIGTDVAFCLAGGTRLATGRGDVLTPLPTPDLAIVLVPLSSNARDKTRRLYGALREGDWSDGSAVQAVAAALRAGQPIEACRLPSAFERVARELYPCVATTWEVLAKAGGIPCLCGAGPSLISLHPTRDSAREVADRLQSEGVATYLVSPQP